MSLGTRKMCVLSCLLILDFNNSSISTLHAAGGGDHTYVPVRMTGTKWLSDRVVHPWMSWPFSNQLSRVRKVALVSSVSTRPLIHSFNFGSLSRAYRWNVMKERKYLPLTTPSFRAPREILSPPWAIICVPGTWDIKAWHPYVISREWNSITISSRRTLLLVPL